MINTANNSFEYRVLTTRFLKKKFILICIQEQIDVFTHFLKMRILTLYVLEFFQVASAIALKKKSTGEFSPQPFRPTLPYRFTKDDWRNKFPWLCVQWNKVELV